MTIEELREQFRKDDLADVKDTRQVCKVLCLAALAPKLFQEANYPWYDEMRGLEEEDEGTRERSNGLEFVKKEIRKENIRRAVELAHQLAEAAFPGAS